MSLDVNKERLKNQTKDQRGERVALLKTSRCHNYIGTSEELCTTTISVLNPTIYTRKTKEHFIKNFLTVDIVECIDEID